MDDRPSDMYQDMKKLNMLYEEMCWDNDDILDQFISVFGEHQIPKKEAK